MKTALKVTLLAFGLLAIAGIARAGNEVKTITGEAKCADVDMHAQSTCQTVVQVKQGDAMMNYYVVENEAAKGLHEKICGNPQQVTATGTVAEKDGKLVLTPTKVEIMPPKSEPAPAEE